MIWCIGDADRANVGLGLDVAHAGIDPATVGTTDMQLSEDIACVLTDYQTHHAWVFHLTEQDPFASTYLMEHVLPDDDSTTRMQHMQRAELWLSSHRVQGSVSIKEVGVCYHHTF